MILVDKEARVGQVEFEVSWFEAIGFRVQL